MLKVSETLTRAADLLEVSEHSKCSLAQNSAGEGVDPDSSEAVSYCARGAVLSVLGPVTTNAVVLRVDDLTYSDWYSVSADAEAMTFVTRAIELIDPETYRELIEVDGEAEFLPMMWNDYPHVTKYDVIEAFRRGAKLADEEGL